MPIIDSVPASAGDFVDFINSMDEVQIPPVFQRKLANRACKTAVKLGDQLSRSYAIELLRRAACAESVLNCPHGRKTVFRL